MGVATDEAIAEPADNMTRCGSLAALPPNTPIVAVLEMKPPKNAATGKPRDGRPDTLWIDDARCIHGAIRHQRKDDEGRRREQQQIEHLAVGHRPARQTMQHRAKREDQGDDGPYRASELWKSRG
jgi:hypothetical protein